MSTRDDSASRKDHIDVLPARKNDVLAEICRAIVRGGSARDLVQESSERLQRYFRTASVGIWFQREDRLVLEGLSLPEEHHGRIAEVVRERWDDMAIKADLPVPRAMRSRSILRWRSDDPELAPPVREVLRGVDAQWIMALPIFVDSDPVGGAAVATAEDTLTAADELLLDSALGVIGVVYRRALLQEVERDHQRKALQAYHMAAVGELAAGVAHEVNNPLASVMNFAELILAEGAEEPVLGWAAAILGEARRAAASMEHLRLFARPGTGIKRPVQPSSVVEDALVLMAAQLEREDLAISRSTDPDVPAVDVDPDRLRHVLHNVLTNARQAMEEDEGGEVRIEIRRVGGLVEIAVEDTGPGMSTSVREAVFRPFFTTRKDREGTGMGLALAYGIVTEAGGEVIAGNWGHPRIEGGAPGAGGARIVIRLPASNEPSAQERPGDAGRRAADQEPPRGLRVLVVEDEEAVARALATYLRRSDDDVVVVSTAEEAVERIEKGPRFDAVISDLRMPGMGGEGLFRVIRDHHPELLERLILASGDVISRDTARFVEESGLPFLRKPYPLEELATALREVTGAGG